MTTTAIDLFDSFATDEKAEQEGVLMPLPGCGDTQFLIAAANNKNYNRMFEKLYKRNKILLDSKGDAADAKAKEILVEVACKTLLLGWQGEPSIQGVATPYSEAAALKLLSNNRFYGLVMAAAKDEDAFLAKKKEEDEKN